MDNTHGQEQHNDVKVLGKDVKQDEHANQSHTKNPSVNKKEEKEKEKDKENKDKLKIGKKLMIKVQFRYLIWRRSVHWIIRKLLHN